MRLFVLCCLALGVFACLVWHSTSVGQVPTARPASRPATTDSGEADAASETAIPVTKRVLTRDVEADNIKVRLVATRISERRGQNLEIKVQTLNDPKQELVRSFAAHSFTTHETTLMNIVRSATDWSSPQSDRHVWRQVIMEVVFSMPSKFAGEANYREFDHWFLVEIRPQHDRHTPATTSAPASQAVSSMSSTATPRSLAGMWFISKEKREVGLGVREPAMGHWHLRFMDSGGKWQHSDVEEGFAYTLLPDGTIKAIVNPSKPIEAQYYPDRNEILWDGLLYRAK